jgi:hypothetical protein
LELHSSLQHHDGGTEVALLKLEEPPGLDDAGGLRIDLEATLEDCSASGYTFLTRNSLLHL